MRLWRRPGPGSPANVLTKAGVARRPLGLEKLDHRPRRPARIGSLAIATFVVPDRNGHDPLVLGLLTSHDDASL